MSGRRRLNFRESVMNVLKSKIFIFSIILILVGVGSLVDAQNYHPVINNPIMQYGQAYPESHVSYSLSFYNYEYLVTNLTFRIPAGAVVSYSMYKVIPTEKPLTGIVIYKYSHMTSGTVTDGSVLRLNGTYYTYLIALNLTTSSSTPVPVNVTGITNYFIKGQYDPNLLAVGYATSLVGVVGIAVFITINSSRKEKGGSIVEK